MFISDSGAPVMFENSKVVVTKPTIPKKQKRNTKKTLKGMRKRWRRNNRRFQFLLLLMQTTFCTQFFPMLRCTSTTSKFITLTDCMRTSFTFPTTSRGPSLNTTEFCIARGTTMKNFWTTIWKCLCLNFFSRE